MNIHFFPSIPDSVKQASTDSALFLLELFLNDNVPPLRNGRIAERVRPGVVVLGFQM
jgi:hypothetical protein